MGTSPGSVATPVARPPEKPVQRTAHTSAVGHGIGLGGNAALYGLGTYGWGAAAAIGGIVLTSLGLKHLRHRRRGGGGLFGGRGSRGGGLLGRLGGRGRSGGGLGLGGGRGRGSGGRGGLFGGGRSGGRAGSSKTGGFLRRLAGNRSSTPRGGGGLPGRGSGRRGGLLGGKGRGARGVGGRSPGSRRGGGGLLGGRGSRSGGSRGGGSRSGLGGSRGGRGGRKGGLLSSLNPFRNRNGSRSRGSAIGRGLKNGGRRLLGWLNPFGGKKKPPKTKKQKQAENQPTGWTEVPLNPNHTKWKDREMGAPAPRRVPKPSGGTTRSGGGGLTKAAEQFAGTLAKPPTEVNTLNTFIADLGDLGGAIEALGGGMNKHSSVVEAGMPAETYAHEQMRQFARQITQIAEGVKGLQADAQRRLALDIERVNNGRKNERGYDWERNQQ